MLLLIIMVTVIQALLWVDRSAGTEVKCHGVECIIKQSVLHLELA